MLPCVEARVQWKPFAAHLVWLRNDTVSDAKLQRVPKTVEGSIWDLLTATECKTQPRIQALNGPGPSNLKVFKMTYHHLPLFRKIPCARPYILAERQECLALGDRGFNPGNNKVHARVITYCSIPPCLMHLFRQRSPLLFLYRRPTVWVELFFLFLFCAPFVSLVGWLVSARTVPLL